MIVVTRMLHVGIGMMWRQRLLISSIVAMVWKFCVWKEDP